MSDIPKNLSITIGRSATPGEPETEAGRTLLRQMQKMREHVGLPGTEPPDAILAIEAEARATYAREAGPGHAHLFEMARAESSAEMERTRAALDGAYRERNALAAAIIRTHPEWPCWLRTAPDAEGWWIVYAETPQGQVSWHIGSDDLDLFGGLENANGEAWDHHSTEEKYRRLAALGDTDG